jgi:hypothetical protein
MLKFESKSVLDFDLDHPRPQCQAPRLRWKRFPRFLSVLKVWHRSNPEVQKRNLPSKCYISPSPSKTEIYRNLGTSWIPWWHQWHQWHQWIQNPWSNGPPVVPGVPGAIIWQGDAQKAAWTSEKPWRQPRDQERTVKIIGKSHGNVIYHLVMTNIAMERSTIFNR